MSTFFDTFKSQSAISSVLCDAKANNLPLAVTGLCGVSAKSFLIGAVSDHLSRKALIICEEEKQALRLTEDLNTIFGGAFYLPCKEFSPAGTLARSRDYEHGKLGTLAKILEKEYSFIVACVEGACQLTLPPEALKKHSFRLRRGMEIKQELLIKKLLQAGYTQSDAVDGVGQFAHRGEIIDIFSAQAEHPVRLDFWGDSIEGIYSFNEEDQRRFENLHEVRIIPAMETLFEGPQAFVEIAGAYLKRMRASKNEKLKESIALDIERAEAGMMPLDIDRYLPIAYDKTKTVLDYCKGDLLFVLESAKSEKRIADYLKMNRAEIKSLTESGVLAKGLDRFFLTNAEFEAAIERRQPIFLDEYKRGSYPLALKGLHHLSSTAVYSWNGKLSELEERFDSLRGSDAHCVVLAGTAKNAKAVYNDLISDGFSAVYFDALPKLIPQGTLCIVPGVFSQSLYFPELNFHWISYNSTGTKKSKKRNKRHRAGDIHSLEELTIGDYIVHNIHGIGIYSGVTPVSTQGITKDYIKISYAKGDVLYVPVTQLDLVSKYIGNAENATVKINSLGSQDWTKTKAKAKASIVKIASQLVELYAKRMSIGGFAFSEDDDMQRDFELRFPYEETPDQKRCVEEIKKDMMSPHPMDRLLCGDVGFGKTEVALRAAFKAVMDGKQVAILVPTTILAMQHYQTILQRMEAFEPEVEMLSRFRSPAEQKSIKERLKKGSIDIVVGTHKLLAKDIVFRDIGLLVIDEEQRFGVAQKEKIKEKFPNVDVLTLSATPIPRTLSMSLSGIRDMSLIEEAPQDRYPIQTFVMEFDPGVVCEAMRRELRRGGQVYYLHNKIEDIEATAAFIHKEIPDAKIGIGHGAMSEKQLSEIWQKLLEREIDILVCTTIIETGVDVPNVNTLIIENADAMGLAQLHQIRGRVGRSNRRASAYLTYRADSILSETASKRLDAIKEFTQFGSGFRIAMRDLEIRGAGSVLGTQQHGQMEAVGYDMYVKLLSEAIAEQRDEPTPAPTKDCLVDLPITAHISERYIASPTQRIAMYRRISDIRTEADAADVLEEFEDRFGKPPATVKGLIEISLMRTKAAKLDIYEISQNGTMAIFRLLDFDVRVIPELQKQLKRVIQLSPNGGKPYLSVKLMKGDKLTEIVNRTLAVMEAFASAPNAQTKQR